MITRFLKRNFLLLSFVSLKLKLRLILLVRELKMIILKLNIFLFPTPKKSKKNPNPSLTRKQKAQNKKMASKRVVVEHAIGGMKSFQILSTKFRNRITKNLVDEFSSRRMMESKNTLLINILQAIISGQV